MNQPAPKESLQERLRMTHLETGLEGLKASVEASIKAPGESAEDAPDARDNETWPFHFEFTDKRKRVWEGDFVNHILTVEQQGYVAVLRSRLQGGQPVESIDSSVNDLNLAIAHMTYSLDEKHRPEWAKGDGLLKLRDATVIFRLFEKVRSHEDRYFRREPDSQAS